VVDVSEGAAPAAAGDNQSALREGLTDSIPIILAVIPFGLMVGVAAAEVGLPLSLAIAMSYIVYAGASQLAALALIATGAPFLVIVVTALLLNLRFLLYSAAMAPHLRGPNLPQRALLAWMLTDQALAFASQRYALQPERGGKVAYYLGLAIPMAVVWTSASTIGVLMQSGIPSDWSLEFAVPIIFLTLWVTSLRRGDRAILTAGLVGVAVAVLAQGLPYNLGLMTATFAGIAAGLVAEQRSALAGDAP